MRIRTRSARAGSSTSSPQGGRELAGALRLLAQWGARHSEAEPVRHAACGTALEARWYCPTCEETVDDPGEDVHYA